MYKDTHDIEVCSSLLYWHISLQNSWRLWGCNPDDLKRTGIIKLYDSTGVHNISKALWAI